MLLSLTFCFLTELFSREFSTNSRRSVRPSVCPFFRPSVRNEIEDNFKQEGPSKFLCKGTSSFGYTTESRVPPKYKVGDRVRIVKKKKTFEKCFTPNWTEELFTIKQSERNKPT